MSDTSPPKFMISSLIVTHTHIHTQITNTHTQIHTHMYTCIFSLENLFNGDFMYLCPGIFSLKLKNLWRSSSLENLILHLMSHWPPVALRRSCGACSHHRGQEAERKMGRSESWFKPPEYDLLLPAMSHLLMFPELLKIASRAEDKAINAWSFLGDSSHSDHYMIWEEKNKTKDSKYAGWITPPNTQGPGPLVPLNTCHLSELPKTLGVVESG